MPTNKVLIIDDETDLLETMKFRLESAGYIVLTATNGITGIEIAKKSVPNLILLDVMMPGIDGFEVLKQLKSDNNTKNIPVIVFSCGSEEEEWAKRALELGSSGYVVKPFEHESLLFTVDGFLKNK